MEEIKFLAGFASKELLRSFNLPEIAILGKSNVGKSTLINLLCKRKNLARVSKNPGCTQQINFFSIKNKLIIVDLPGYGFAKVSKQMQDNWQDLILYYIANSKNLLQIILLIDSRRGIKENDLSVIELILSCNRSFNLVFTKIDKISGTDMLELKNQVQRLRERYLCSPQIFFTSNKETRSAQKLQNYIFNSI